MPERLKIKNTTFVIFCTPLVVLFSQMYFWRPKQNEKVEKKQNWYKKFKNWFRVKKETQLFLGIAYVTV